MRVQQLALEWHPAGWIFGEADAVVLEQLCCHCLHDAALIYPASPFSQMAPGKHHMNSKVHLHVDVDSRVLVL